MKSQSNSQLDKILNILTLPFDVGDLPPNVGITSPSRKIAEAKTKLLDLALSCLPKKQTPENYDASFTANRAIDTIEQNILGRFS